MTPSGSAIGSQHGHPTLGDAEHPERARDRARAVMAVALSLAHLGRSAPVGLERWFARQGAPPRLDLARSGAAALATADLLRIAGPAACASAG